MCNPFTLNSKCNRPHGHRTRPVNINLDDSLLHRLLSTDAGDFMSTIATQAPAAIEFPLPRSPFIASKPASQGRFSPTHTHTLCQCIPLCLPQNGRIPLYSEEFYSQIKHLKYT